MTNEIKLAADVRIGAGISNPAGGGLCGRIEGMEGKDGVGQVGWGRFVGGRVESMQRRDQTEVGGAEIKYLSGLRRGENRTFTEMPRMRPQEQSIRKRIYG